MTSPLTQFSTCELSDALVKLSVPHGGLIPDINIYSPLPSPANPPFRICGPAYTVRMVPASDTASPKLSSHFVDTAPENSIIVISAPPQTKNAVWGGLMSAGAQARSVQGVIISGRCRDLSEHRSLGFPVFARGHSTLGQSPFTRPSEINIPLTIQPIPNYSSSSGDHEGDRFPAVTVHPGDWMVADEDGVVCVPKDLEHKVIELAARGRQIDDLCMQDIKAGKGVQASFKLHRGK